MLISYQTDHYAPKVLVNPYFDFKKLICFAWTEVKQCAIVETEALAVYSGICKGLFAYLCKNKFGTSLLSLHAKDSSNRYNPEHISHTSIKELQ
jgi:hypothetical protein